MDAPLCKNCKSRHWGGCANSPTVKALAAVVKAKAKTKPPNSQMAVARKIVKKRRGALRVLATNQSLTASRRIKKAASKSIKAKAGKPAMSKAVARAAERAAEVEQVKKTKARSVGRPLNSQNAQAPWIALGLSRRTFFRRKKAGMLAT